MLARVGIISTELQGLDYPTRMAIDKAFAVKIPGIQFQPKIRQLLKTGAWDGCHHFFDMRNNRLPTGLLPKLQQSFKIEIEDYQLKDYQPLLAKAKTYAQTVELNGIKLRDEQRKAVVAGIDYPRGIFQLATNFGKTAVYAALIRVLNLPTLVLIHRKDLLHQTAQRLEEYLGIPVGKIGDGSKTEGALVTVAMQQSLDVRSNRKMLERYNVVVFDEGQHLSSATQQKISKAMINAPFRWAFSGSYPEETMKRFLIMSATSSQLICDYSSHELIDLKRSASPIVHVIPIKYEGAVFPDTRSITAYQESVQKYIVEHKDYHSLIVKEVDKWYREKQSIFILVDRLAHGRAISRLLDNLHIKHVYLTGAQEGFYRRQCLDEFRRGQIQVVLASVIFDEGVDAPALSVLVLSAGGKSTVRLLQRVGRALRKKEIGENCAHIIDFIHDDKGYLMRHSKRRMNIYKREQFDIKMEPEVILQCPENEPSESTTIPAPPSPSVRDADVPP